VADKLNAALRAALKDPEFIKRQEALGAVVVTDAASTRPSTRSSSRPRSSKWGPAIKAAGQYAD
jgi:tripartite-type tricarboxylate transporter receptor subunit TctC